MKNKIDKYVWVSVIGTKNWDLIGTVQTIIGVRTGRVGTIKFDYDALEFRFFRAWNVIHTNGNSNAYAGAIADKLRELNASV